MNEQENKRMHPIWILISITLPQFILCGIIVGSLGMVHTLFKEDGLIYWYMLLAFTIMAVAGFTGYAAVLFRQRKGISPALGLLSIGFFVPVLMAFMYHGFRFFPREVPNWMMDRADMEMYMMAFYMAPILLGLFVLVKGVAEEGIASIKEIGLVFFVPVVWYFATIGIFAVVGSDTDVNQIFTGGSLILAALFFAFLLLRGFFFLSTKYSKKINDGERIILVILAGTLPLIGLSLNLSLDNIFGDFSHPLFFILALANGIFVCIPSPENTSNRLALFLLRSFSYCFIIYFFIVFLPFLPFSLPAILALGMGFLMMVPLVLTIMQGRILMEDVKFLRQRMPVGQVIALGLLAFMALPVALTVHFHKDKYYFQTAIDYMYHPNLQEEAPAINTASIARVLRLVHSHTDRRRDFLFGNSNTTPYISNFYQAIVLDNMTLSNQKLQEMERTFTGKSNTRGSSRPKRLSQAKNISIDELQALSTFDEEGGFWRSTVQIDIQNHTERRFTEYASNFSLPEGAYISDYYLMIEGRKEKGILAEKKAALWIYNQITSTNRDPGLLFYQDNEQIHFRVFPFTAQQKRQTGFEIIHKEPFTFQLDDQIINLGEANAQPALQDLGHLTYVNVPYKKQLSKTARKPYLHLIIDYSENNIYLTELLNAVEQLKSRYPDLLPNSKISLTNYRSERFNLADWDPKNISIKQKGGFFPERVIQQELVHNYENPKAEYPIFVLIAGPTHQGLNLEKLEALDFTMPEKNCFFSFYSGDKNLQAINQKAPENEKKIPLVIDSTYAYPSLENPTAFLPINDQPSLIVKDADFDFSAAASKSQWEKGLNLQGFWFASQLRPHRDDENWREQVRLSFEAQVMSPVTSLIALENEAQKNILRKKQEQTLKGDSALDLSEEVTNMDEPPYWLIIVILVAVIGVRFWMEERVDKD